MAASVRVTRESLRLVLEHARKDSIRECCGLLAGRDGAITHVFPATNAAPNPVTSYEIAPQEIFQRMREMRAAGLELLGIYHSHPNGKNEPSPRDIELAYYPDAAYFIISPLADSARPVRAFSIRDRHLAELEIEIVA
jgi:[CysO sulfur-carrier protein]-S-L-cysteine hydrolase